VPSVEAILGHEQKLPQLLSEHGYRTACFTDNPHLSAGRGIVRSFDHVDRSVGRWRALVVGTALGELVERLLPGSDSALAAKAISWTRQQEGPFFLYLHLMDSHTPYRFDAFDGVKHRGRRVEFPYTGMSLTSSEASWIRARYDAGVRSADKAAARVIAAVADLERPFVVIITSDHGESLGEDRRWFHGDDLSTERLAVPLVVLGSEVLPALVDTPVGHAAITSTVLAAGGVPCPECSEPDLRFEAGRGLAEGGLPPYLAYRIRDGHKLLLDARTGRTALYDIVRDPGDHHDLSYVLPSVAARLAAGLSVSAPTEQLPSELIERLKSLGYSASGP
jgi:arylsulfatase A-like enzyme